MAVIPKQVVGSLGTKLEPGTRISCVWLTEPGTHRPAQPVDTDSSHPAELLHQIEGARVSALRLTLSGLRHPVDVVAVGTRLVELRPHCRFRGCGCEFMDTGPPFPARSGSILGRARTVAAEADLAAPQRLGDHLPSRRRRRAEPGPTTEDPGEVAPSFPDEPDDVTDRDDSWIDGLTEPPETDWESAPETPDDPGSSRTEWVWSGLQDLINPPASWSPNHDALAAALGAVAAGTDMLSDLCPDDDAWSIRRSARRLEAGLGAFTMLDVPRRGQEREWIAARVRATAAPHRSLLDQWQSLDTGRRDALAMAVDTATWLFEGVPSSGLVWCERAAELLDEAADVVPESLRARFADPLDLLTSASLELATACLAGAVPGSDVTGVDLWFRAGAAFAELGARGPILGANERGDLPAEGLVVVLGDAAARRSFIDTVELCLEGVPSVRLGDAEPTGPHLAALAVSRGGRPVLLNLPTGESLFAHHASLPHIRVEFDRITPDDERVAEEVRQVVDRWAALAPLGRDPWWENQPRLYLPAIIQALLADEPLPLSSTRLVDALDEDRIDRLIHRVERLGLDRVADRLRALFGMGTSGTTGLSLRITITGVIPEEPVVRELQLNPAALRSAAVILPPAATARLHAAADIAAADIAGPGVAILWDSAGDPGPAPAWMARHARGLVVEGFSNLDTAALPLDDLRGATVVALPGCGDLSPLAGRTIDVAPGEAALVVDGSLTLIEPADVLLADAVRTARRDGLARQSFAIVRSRLDD